MCSVCGCDIGEARINGRDSHALLHSHDHGLIHDHSQHAPSQTRLVEIEQNILAKNQHFADENRALWNSIRTLSVNFVSSPGAGKTTLLLKTIGLISGERPIAVIEGDQQTEYDADLIRRTGVPAVQINTGKGCHLDAHMVGHAAADLAIQQDSYLFIENVGNLVCPAGFDLGEHKRVVILSTTEGHDKPAKYPDAFATADLLLLTKIDLLPYLDFDVQAAIGLAKDINPSIEVIPLAAKTGQGMEDWVAWLQKCRASVGMSAAPVSAKDLPCTS